MTIAIAVVLALMVGGGVSLAAQSSVPGDSLYSVKTGINENVASAFAFSHEAEANLQARLVDERFEEAEELALRGELNAEASVELQERIRAHYDRATEEIRAVENNGDVEAAAEISASFADSMNEHQNMLAEIGMIMDAEMRGEQNEVDTSLDMNTDVNLNRENDAVNTNSTSTIETSVDQGIDVSL